VSDPPELGLHWGRPITNRDAKERIARTVAAEAASGDVIGCGSGSTSFLTVLELGRRRRVEGLDVLVVPTSIEIQLACEAVGLIVAPDAGAAIDWCFDGADEVDPDGRLIKGRGGALYRERIVFAAAARRKVIADPSKSVERLGSVAAVPVEVEPTLVRRAHAELAGLDHVEQVELRMAVAKDGPVITEGGRVLLDVRCSLIDDTDEARLSAIPGVVATGIFSGFSFERVAGDEPDVASP
jgi:ribose 5-phosphate isomerase A